MNILLTGGGTGGHVYPALAIADALRERSEARPLLLLYVGTRDRLEARIVPPTGIPIEYVSAAPLQRRLSLALVRTLARNVVGIVQSLFILHRFRPDCVVATGGYVTFPVVAAMRLVRFLRLTRGRIGLLEPNARPGLTNRLLTPLVDELWLTYADGALNERRAVVTGTPVRAGFGEPMDPRRARAALGLDPDKTTIVVMGGSQGARSLNEAATALRVPEGWQMLLLTGRSLLGAGAPPPRAGGALVAVEYLDDPRALYAAADVVVARAGASTLAELAAFAKPAILVPYPHATDGHQMHNAARFAVAGAARVIPDAELSGARLLAELSAILEPATLEAMRRAAARVAPSDARERIAGRVVALCAEN